MTTLTICTPDRAHAHDGPTAAPDWLTSSPNTSGITAIELCEHVSLSPEQSDALALLRRRIAARERKRKSRQASVEVLLPLPKGTADALSRVMAAADFDDPRDFIAFQIHRLDALLARDGHSFREQAVRTVTLAGDPTVARYAEQLSNYQPEEGEDHE